MANDSRDRYIRSIDFDAIDNAEPGSRKNSTMLIGDVNHTMWGADYDMNLAGGKNCVVNYIRVPPGSGSPRGIHSHEWQQMCFILRGTLTFDIEGERYEANPGDLVVCPPGTKHQHQNLSSEPTIHISINT